MTRKGREQRVTKEGKNLSLLVKWKIKDKNPWLRQAQKTFLAIYSAREESEGRESLSYIILDVST
jgi:hypothetical protein